MKKQLKKYSGIFLEKTVNGFYKTSYLCLVNKELYIYDDKE